MPIFPLASNMSHFHFFQGKSVGPTVDPSKVGDKLKKPNAEKGKGSKRVPGLRSRGDKSGVPQICLPFRQKKRNPVSYNINCINYLSDTTIPHYYNRECILIHTGWTCEIFTN